MRRSLLAVLMILGSCSDHTTGQCDGLALDVSRASAKRDDATTAEADFTRLHALLTAEEAFAMPPAGVAFHANDLTATVEAIAAQPTIAGEIEQLTPTFLTRHHIEGSTLFDLMQGDVHVRLHAGFLDAEILDSLISMIADQQVKTEVHDIIMRLSGELLEVESYDIGAEILGLKVIVFRPFDQPQALRIQLQYMQA
jgi:hypothetical protein